MQSVTDIVEAEEMGRNYRRKLLPMLLCPYYAGSDERRAFDCAYMAEDFVLRTGYDKEELQ